MPVLYKDRIFTINSSNGKIACTDFDADSGRRIAIPYDMMKPPTEIVGEVITYWGLGEVTETLEKRIPRRIIDNIDVLVLAESALSQDWLTPEEDEAWKHL